jgi:DNA-binding GntR family transcriptional regulator
VVRGPIEVSGASRRGLLAEDLYAQLRADILDGRLGPGERLVEESIAQQASVSRTPVREALRKLEADGLIQVSGRGLVVAGVDAADLVELSTVREALEGLAANIATVRRSDVDVATLEQIVDEARQAAGTEDVIALVTLDHLFHEAVWRASGNRYLANLLGTLRARIEGVPDDAADSAVRRQEAQREHEGILDAIRAQDGAGCQAMAVAHCRAAAASRLASLTGLRR